MKVQLCYSQKIGEDTRQHEEFIACVDLSCCLAIFTAAHRPVQGPYRRKTIAAISSDRHSYSQLVGAGNISSHRSINQGPQKTTAGRVNRNRFLPPLLHFSARLRPSFAGSTHKISSGYAGTGRKLGTGFQSLFVPASSFGLHSDVLALYSLPQTLSVFIRRYYKSFCLRSSLPSLSVLRL